MDLVPKPDQVVTAAGNVAHSLLYGGLADLRPMPRTLIDDGELREVYHYLPDPEAPTSGDPVLLVTPLAAPALCFDLRRGCSLVEHLVRSGRPTYLVEYGQVSFKNRNLGIEHWIDEVLPEAIQAVHRHSGNRPVHLVGWSLGGIFALLTAADRPDLPIASLSVIGSPVDVKKVPLMAPRPLVNWAFTAASVQKVVTKPLAIMTHLDDTEFLAQIEAVGRFTDNMIAYPGRSFGQLYHRFVKGNTLAQGTMDFADRSISLSQVTAPVLIFGGATDGIAPVASVKPAVDLLSGSREARFEIVPGGHLGMLTGRAARSTTWPLIEEWIDQWSAAEAPAKKTTSKKAPAKKSAPRKAPAKKAAAKKVAAKSAPAIGSNPKRRHGSAGSRALAP